ncbi:threonine efflux protein [Amycolatopsis sp. NBRC 101858]|uniref:LysE family translocator n=1 Tax=Amycolatopsis sp. NBRC 101858 TaxID=3032200 RepID=UPI0024A1D42B|nr:LysE family transporter [Amycolatopsis sp. NBRC 101858]GLY40218.1 threonine efflux protein [Amycolatopsis sp. NBRC 101858]
MNPAATLGTVLLAYLPAAVSPGPNFVLIAHTAAAGSRRAAVAVALGVVAAGGVLAAVAVFGLGGVLARLPWLAAALRVVCGGYLAWLGVRLWLRARKPKAPEAPDGAADRGGEATLRTSGAGEATPTRPGKAPPGRGQPHHFRRGVLSNLTNPKAAAFFGSVLTATLPPAEPTAVKAAAVALILLTSAAWHLSVALLFSAPATQRWYAHAEPTLNRVVGTILVVLGVALAATP